MTSRSRTVRRGHRPRILFSECSSVSARQALYALGRTGLQIDVCDPNPLFSLGRYSRFVRRVYRCPSFTADPEGYLRFLIGRLSAEHYDVLLPTHDQVFLLSRFRKVLERFVGLPVPDFADLERLQSKAEFLRVLDELGIPHPPTRLLRTRQDLVQAITNTSYIKLPYSTAGCGVWLVRTPGEAAQVADNLANMGLLAGDTEVLVQEPAQGVLSVVQSVFQDGRLLSAHCYQARALGVGGSARARVGAKHPIVLDHLAVLGAHLRWHGALSLDYIWDQQTGRPSYIDANPRIGETLNATLSGTNLCELLVEVGKGAVSRPPSRSARLQVKTHSVAMTLLAEAQAGATRRRLLAELARAWKGSDVYAGSQDEVTRPRDDALSVIPLCFLVVRLLVSPRLASRVITGTVNNYSLSEPAARRIRELTLTSVEIEPIGRRQSAKE
jgi:hypothetical protein